MTHKPEGLRQRLTRELVILLLLFQLLVFIVSGVLIVRPLLNAATADLAVVMQSAAHAWLAEREAQVRHSNDQANALLLQLDEPLLIRDSYLPFARVLGQSLSERVNQGAPTPVRIDAQGRYWAPLHLPQATVWVGFEAQRIGTRPPLLLALIGLLLVVLAVAYSRWVAWRVAQPMRALVKASQRLGQGDTKVRVAETGPREMVILAQAFNALAERLRELLDNRATLLVGLSHDLRTPLARLRLALEMIEGTANQRLVAGMVRDLDAVNALLDDVLSLERGLHLEAGQQASVSVIIEQLLQTYRALHTIQWQPCDCPVEVSERALQRVLDNLLSNAIRYAGQQPVELRLDCAADAVCIEIIDKGPGIPAAERKTVMRPFYRLENSRNNQSGGSGLGLAIVQQICRAQAWRFELADNQPAGLIARLYIPT